MWTWTICFSKMRTLLVGDSHVRRFENYAKGSLRNDTFIVSDLEIFDFCGISGGSIANHAHTRAIISAVRNTRPQHVIVNLGGNDLDSSEDIECLIYRLLSFASLLKRQFHICTVVILVLCIVLSQGTYKLQVTTIGWTQRTNCSNHTSQKVVCYFGSWKASQTVSTTFLVTVFIWTIWDNTNFTEKLGEFFFCLPGTHNFPWRQGLHGTHS